MSGYIPHAYSKVLQDFFNRVNRHDQQHRIELLEYSRAQWTFHAKGLWICLPEDTSPDDLPSLTMIGSPNFGLSLISPLPELDADGSRDRCQIRSA